MNDTARSPQFVYDRVAYPGYVVPLLAPSRLRASALLHGFRGPDPASASVLEIGCGEGVNLTAFAAISPNATAVGFDLSADAIVRGRSLVDACGLTNVDLQVGDALTYPRDGKKFDYITCHGVLSWVPEPVRPAILELIGARLAPGGIAYVSFDCLPGAAAKASMVPFLRDWVGDITDPDEALRKGAQGLVMINRSQRYNSRLQAQLEVLAKNLPSFDSAYFFHDWLAEHYAPIDLRQFIPLAKANNLRFAGSASGYDLVLDDLEEDARGLLDSFGDDAGRKLAALDILHGGHIFHRDLLIRTDAPPEATNEGITEVSASLMGRREEVEVEQGRAIRYSVGEKAKITTNRPSTIAVLDCLMDASPAELSHAEIRSRSGVEDKQLKDILLQAAMMEVVTTNAARQPFVVHPGERPRAGLVSRTMLAEADRAITLRGREWHVSDAPSQYLVVLCDGTRTRAEIASALSAALNEDVGVDKVDEVITRLARLQIFEA